MCAVIAIVPVGWRQAHSWCAGRHVHNGSGVGSRQLDQLQRAGDCRGGSIARSMPATPMPQAVALCRGSACLARFSSGVISPYSGGLAMACGGTSPPVLHRAGKKPAHGRFLYRDDCKFKALSGFGGVQHFAQLCLRYLWYQAVRYTAFF